MAERLFRSRMGEAHESRSAGSDPGAAVHPEVVEALTEIGIDATDHRPHKLTQADTDWADLVVATCDGACPVVPGKPRLDWHLPDPKGRPLPEVRRIRDEIARRVDALISELDG